MKSTKFSIILNSCIGAASLAVISFLALFTMQNPQALMYCYQGIGAVLGISFVGAGASFFNLKNAIFSGKRQDNNNQEISESISIIQTDINREHENITLSANEPSLDSDFVSTWKEMTPDEKSDFVSKEFQSPDHDKFTVMGSKKTKTK
ncbi:MAG: hypothetical protein V8R01_08500 [Bacilli bacterium]